MKRSGTRGAVAACLFAMVAPCAHAQAQEERVVLPFNCSTEGGKLRLSNASPTPYRILGRRQTRAIKVCGSRSGAPCTTTVVHRFTLSCGEGTVEWLELAALAARAKGLLAEVSQNKLTLIQRRKAPSTDHCYEKLSRFDIVEETCWTSSGSRLVSVAHTFPPGFAPAHIAGARFERGAPSGSEEPIIVGSLPPTVSEDVQPNPLAHRIKLMPEAALDRDSSTAPDSARGVAAAGTWTTRLVSASETAGQDAAGRSLVEVQTTTGGHERTASIFSWLPQVAALVIAFGLLALLLVVPAGRRFIARLREAIVLRRTQAFNAQLVEKAEAHAKSGEDDMIASLKTMALAALAAIQPQLAALPGGWPLRAVLLKEVTAAGEKLDRMFGEIPRDDEQIRRLRNRLQAVVADLRRLKEIADSANYSLAEGVTLAAGEPVVPTDRDSAYAVLGVNPDVSDKVAKKVVDALRQSWHPDHARDEPDRIHREARIKQINIAWELISRARVEA